MTPCPNCKKLQARIDELEAELSNRDDEAAAAESRMVQANARAREAESAIRRAKQDAEDAEYFRENITREITRARERGDQSAVDYSLNRLRRGW